MANRFNDYWLRIRELRTLVEHLDADDRSFVLNPPSDPANDGSDDLIEIQDGNTPIHVPGSNHSAAQAPRFITINIERLAEFRNECPVHRDLVDKLMFVLWGTKHVYKWLRADRPTPNTQSLEDQLRIMLSLNFGCKEENWIMDNIEAINQRGDVTRVAELLAFVKAQLNPEAAHEPRALPVERNGAPQPAVPRQSVSDFLASATATPYQNTPLNARQGGARLEASPGPITKTASHKTWQPGNHIITSARAAAVLQFQRTFFPRSTDPPPATPCTMPSPPAGTAPPQAASRQQQRRAPAFQPAAPSPGSEPPAPLDPRPAPRCAASRQQQSPSAPPARPIQEPSATSTRSTGAVRHRMALPTDGPGEIRRTWLQTPSPPASIYGAEESRAGTRVPAEAEARNWASTQEHRRRIERELWLPVRELPPPSRAPPPRRSLVEPTVERRRRRQSYTLDPPGPIHEQERLPLNLLTQPFTPAAPAERRDPFYDFGSTRAARCSFEHLNYCGHCPPCPFGSAPDPHMWPPRAPPFPYAPLGTATLEECPATLEERPAIFYPAIPGPIIDASQHMSTPIRDASPAYSTTTAAPLPADLLYSADPHARLLDMHRPDATRRTAASAATYTSHLTGARSGLPTPPPAASTTAPRQTLPGPFARDLPAPRMAPRDEPSPRALGRFLAASTSTGPAIIPMGVGYSINQSMPVPYAFGNGYSAEEIDAKPNLRTLSPQPQLQSPVPRSRQYRRPTVEEDVKVDPARFDSPPGDERGGAADPEVLPAHIQEHKEHQINCSETDVKSEDEYDYCTPPTQFYSYPSNMERGYANRGEHNGDDEHPNYGGDPPPNDRPDGLSGDDDSDYDENYDAGDEYATAVEDVWAGGRSSLSNAATHATSDSRRRGREHTSPAEDRGDEAAGSWPRDWDPCSDAPTPRAARSRTAPARRPFAGGRDRDATALAAAAGGGDGSESEYVMVGRPGSGAKRRSVSDSSDSSKRLRLDGPHDDGEKGVSPGAGDEVLPGSGADVSPGSNQELVYVGTKSRSHPSQQYRWSDRARPL